MNHASFSFGGVTYRQQLIKCGKPACRKCPHGPYWYAVWWSKGRWRTQYVGKELPERIKVPGEEPKRPPQPKPLSRQAARNILGITSADNYQSGLKKWHKLRKEAEALGEEGRQAVVALNRAWESICSELA